MGVLVAKAYPTILFAKAADHTYVECGTGRKGWSCWGGKSNGTEITRGIGSTLRADAIAQPDEKANIKCYLVNGVCHQAANRILLPAGKLVLNARGYGLSSTIFGPYGRELVWPCSSPFLQYPEISGDLPECVGSSEALESSVDTESAREESLFIQKSLNIYDRAGMSMAVESGAGEEAMTETESAMIIELFNLFVEYRLKSAVDATKMRELNSIRKPLELDIQQNRKEFSKEEKSPLEFVLEFNRLVTEYQEKMKGLLAPADYQQLYNVDPTEDAIFLADPEIVKAAYGVDLLFDHDQNSDSPH